jgi:5-(carboxyamino)imidazole ribonucleotide synthase
MAWNTDKIGILGGGQLGKMLCEAASPIGISLHLLDIDESFPAASVSPNYVCGDFRNYDDVMTFGKSMDVLSIEIENVNTDALEALQASGKKVFPQPHIIDLIKDKGKQKQFYLKHHFPSSKFWLFENQKEIKAFLKNHPHLFPVFQKSRTEGYDGRGVQRIASSTDLDKIWDTPSLIEEAISIDKEIAVIVARDQNGQSVCYPAVEMHFHPVANLLEYQQCPANLSSIQESNAQKLAVTLAEKLEIVGLLAVEMFIDENGACLINEIAPRPHNSGHHTIEANSSSQYEQLVRILAGLPLGNTDMKSPSILLNVLGSKNYTGPAKYVGVEECLALAGVHLHLYGKKITKPFRKMGHVCIVDSNLEAATEKANFVKKHLKVISQS